MHWRVLFPLLMMLGCQFSSLAQSRAVLPEPTWVKQIKLSGISGSADHRLAVVNGKTFSTGEEYDLKLKGKTAHVRCLEIREQSVLVQIQDLPSRYELTISGDILALGNNPAAALPPQPVATIVPPAPARMQPVKTFISSQMISPPRISDMISSPITICFFSAIIISLLVGFALGAGTAQQRHKKDVGEAMLANTISNEFYRPHLLLNNVTLATAGGTTQIDHILVADTGIFVIETKHYTGWIFGDPQSSQWTQTIYRKKSRFQNPLHQNYGHVKTLETLFDLPEDHFHPVVVFTGDAEFKSDLGPNVIQLTNLISFLTVGRPVVFDQRKMASIVGRIEMKRERRSVETDEYHINHVRKRIAGKSTRQSPRNAPPRLTPEHSEFPSSAAPSFTSENPFVASTSPPRSDDDSRYMPKA